MSAGAPRSLWQPATGVVPQVPPVQTAVRHGSVGVGHTVQDAPQLLGSLSALQLLPHAWKPVLHAMPHEVPSQVAVPLVGTTHGMHSVPQVAGSLLDAQLPAQS
jgi:hypothetical protein